MEMHRQHLSFTTDDFKLRVLGRPNGVLIERMLCNPYITDRMTEIKKGKPSGAC